MKSRPNTRCMFAGGNTPEGFVNYFGEILEYNTNRVFIIKGGPGVGKSTFMKKIGQDLLEKGYDLEYFYCSSDPYSLDAVAVPQLKVAIMDGTAPHVIDPSYPGAVEEIIYFGEYWDNEALIANKGHIMEYTNQIKGLFNTAYSQLKEAKVAYDEWKSYVQSCLNRAEYQRQADLFIGRVFKRFDALGKKSRARHYFACAITPSGIKDYADTLLKPGMDVYPIYGGPGSGAKELLMRIAHIAEWQGFFTERSHCPIEPDHLDMVIIPELNAALLNIWEPFRNTVPKGEGINLKEGIDLSLCIDEAKLGEEGRKALLDSRRRFLDLLNKAINNIAQAKVIHDQLESYYISAMDFEKIERIRQQIVQRMLKYENS
ncbi:hypothetical protein JOD02_001806 [Caldicoprobacter guelmensis]|uniref:PRK06851 family protein n=1 Tax=Caldicoprobacter guelmensis TaxID=1170224 RepID=UPI001958F379|nr:PRK06851 family protein [Caldicoprobacter guelmensis]MBM7582937.1 hypothetical protein [Caldicoprobacter guelmensis]